MKVPMILRSNVEPTFEQSLSHRLTKFFLCFKFIIKSLWVLILIHRIYSWSYHSWMVVFEWHPTEKLAQIQIFERNPWLPKWRSFTEILSIMIWFSFVISTFWFSGNIFTIHTKYCLLNEYTTLVSKFSNLLNQSTESCLQDSLN